MFPYAMVMVPACLFLLGIRNMPDHIQRRISYVFAIIITIFAGARGYVGTDTHAYHRMFNEFNTDGFEEIIRFTEPMFALLIKLSAFISESSFVFIALIALIQGLILVRILKASPRPADFLAIYIAVFFVNFQFNILRAGTAILLLLAARQVWHQKNGMPFYFLCFAAVFAHYSAMIAVFPMIFLRNGHVSKKIFMLFVLPLMIGVIFYFMVSPDQYERYLSYSQDAHLGESAQYGVGFFIYLLMYFLLYLSVLNEKNFWPLTFLFFLWMSLRWLSNHIYYLDRIEIIINALFLYGMLERKAVGWKSHVRLLASTSLVFLGLYGTLINLSQADAGVRSMPMSKDEIVTDSSPYIPYKFFWDE